jgi:SAM-dependent methyltransferase
VFDLLDSLIVDSPRRVLDIGCGTGDTCRALASRVDHVDAVDFSAAMITRGKELPGGASPNITWIEGAVEGVVLAGPYALITAGDSIHWMDWDVLLPRFANLLTERGYLAVIERNWDGSHDSPTWRRVAPIFRAFANKQFNEPFDLFDGLRDRGFQQAGKRVFTAGWHPTVDEYIECRHSQNSFLRGQMGEERSASFDQELRPALESLMADGSVATSPDGRMELEVRATVTWGSLTSVRRS